MLIFLCWPLLTGPTVLRLIYLLALTVNEYDKIILHNINVFRIRDQLLIRSINFANFTKFFRILHSMEDWKRTRNLVKCQGHKSPIQLQNFFVSIVNSCLSELGSCIKWPVLLHVMKQYFNTKVKLMPRATFEGCCKIGQTFASSPYYSGP